MIIVVSVVSFGIRKCESSYSVLLFQDYFGSFRSLAIPCKCEFGDQPVDFSKEASWDFDRVYVESVDQFGD